MEPDLDQTAGQRVRQFSRWPCTPRPTLPNTSQAVCETGWLESVGICPVLIAAGGVSTRRPA